MLVHANDGDFTLKRFLFCFIYISLAELYRQSFPSTESLDRSVSMKSRDSNGPPPPLPPSRHDRDPHSGIDLAYPPPTLDSFTGNASPPPSYHSQMHYSPRLPPHPLPLPSSLYATGRRRPPAPERALPFPPYELKKSSSLKSCGIGMPSTPSAPSLSHPSSGQGARIPDDLDASDSITDDDDTISSGLSGDYWHLLSFCTYSEHLSFSCLCHCMDLFYILSCTILFSMVL